MQKKSKQWNVRCRERLWGISLWHFINFRNTLLLLHFQASIRAVIVSEELAYIWEGGYQLFDFISVFSTVNFAKCFLLLTYRIDILNLKHYGLRLIVLSCIFVFLSENLCILLKSSSNLHFLQYCKNSAILQLLNNSWND